MNKQTAHLLEQHFDTAFSAPNGIKKLRELILTLAMQGKLVPQEPSDAPASQLLKEIEAEKKRLVKEGKIKAPKPLTGIKAEEVPHALPDGWVWVRLGDVCSYIQRGKGPAYADISSHRVLSQKCVRWYGLDLEPARFIETESLRKYEPIRFLKGGDLLWNSTGTGTIGRACLVPTELEPSELVADSHVTVVRVLLLNSVFLWRWIQSPTVQYGIESAASGTTNQIELNTSTVINYLMPLPPLQEQHRIVAKIDQLMARCDALENLRNAREEKRLAIHSAALSQLLDTSGNGSADGAWAFIVQHFGELYAVKENVARLRRAILQLAVMGKLVPQNPNDPPASQLLKEIEAEKKRLVKEGKLKKLKPPSRIAADELPFALPESWLWVRIEEIAQAIDYGTSQKTGNDSSLVPVYRMGNIVDGRLIDDGFKYLPPDIDDLPKLYLKRNDILFNRTNSYELVGKSALYTGQNDHATFASYLIRVRLSEKRLQPIFFGLAMNAPYFRSTQIEPEIVQQCGQANFNGTKLSLCLVPLPPLNEQGRIVAKIDDFMTLCDTLEQHIATATRKQTELLDAVMAQV